MNSSPAEVTCLIIACHARGIQKLGAAIEKAGKFVSTDQLVRIM